MVRGGEGCRRSLVVPAKAGTHNPRQ